ncbi:condensation domain-containing protein [Kitasatospora paranensis]|uniref:Condensation domain-containing protein n=1 Tax=Kitasatospora paranensis TaxID=258053 RepID=A0ABW2FYA8_9ACTN
MHEPAPLSYGQLSVWRDVRELGRDRWHEANTRTIWPLAGEGEPKVSAVEDAVLALAARHESLRTVYGLSDPYAPVQRVLPSVGEVDSGTVECGPEEFDGVVAALAAAPFDLSAAPAWRFRVVTVDDRPRAVVLIGHHIVADGWSNTILESDFRAALRGQVPPGAAAPPTPRELAGWQRSPDRRARQAALTAYWERIFGLPAASLRTAGAPAPPDDACQYSVRSRQASAAARRLAEQLTVPVSSVVLAAFTWSVARLAGPGPLVAQLMSSNRFVPPWTDVVSSMNQWTAASVGAAPDAFVPYVRHVHTQSLLAYRHGMYDVDEIDALRDRAGAGRAPHQASCAFNFLTDGPAPPGADEESGPVREVPFSRIGHPCYLRATDEAGATLELRLRTMGIADTVTRDILDGTVARLSDPAS